MTFTQICNKVYFLANTNATDFPIADLTQSANNALERVASLIMTSDGRWQWDDTNQSDLPIATTTITADQQDYSMSVTHLKVTRVEVKNEDGDWNLLTPIDQADIYNQSLTDFLNTSGDPGYYDKIGNSIFLYPKPDYTQAASLKVFYQRAPVAFDTSDTTDVPGFNSLYHILLPLYIAYEYCLAKGKTDKLQVLGMEIAKVEDKLKEDYALRNKDEHIRLSGRQHNFY